LGVTTPPFLSGQLLLSMPGISDPRFERSVIAMCMHDEDGALGLICNMAMPDLTVADLMRQLDIDPGETPDRPVLAGGPVEPQRGFILHSPEYQGQGTVNVSGTGKGWGLTATLDILKDIAAGRGPRQWLAAVGYAGWGAGQLDEEMTRHGWLSAPGDAAILFDTPLNERWPAAFAAVGVNVGQLSAQAGRA
jgi:putative transcriptional regulator